MAEETDGLYVWDSSSLVLWDAGQLPTVISALADLVTTTVPVHVALSPKLGGGAAAIHFCGDHVHVEVTLECTYLRVILATVKGFVLARAVTLSKSSFDKSTRLPSEAQIRLAVDAVFSAVPSSPLSGLILREKANTVAELLSWRGVHAGRGTVN